MIPEYLATKNSNKLKEFNEILKDIKLEQIEVTLLEPLRSGWFWKSFAEMTPEEKNSVSMRKKALEIMQSSITR